MSIYEPNVACYGPPTQYRGTGQDLLALIPVTTDPQIFGPEGEAGVDVVVPKRFGRARVISKCPNIRTCIPNHARWKNSDAPGVTTRVAKDGIQDSIL